jgi:hypothetical protein
VFNKKSKIHSGLITVLGMKFSLCNEVFSSFVPKKKGMSLFDKWHPKLAEKLSLNPEHHQTVYIHDTVCTEAMDQRKWILSGLEDQ